MIPADYAPLSRSESETVSLICGVAESGAIKAGKIQPRNIRRYESRYAIKDRRMCLEKYSNGTRITRDSALRAVGRPVEMQGIISLNRAFYNGRDNAKAKPFNPESFP